MKHGYIIAFLALLFFSGFVKAQVYVNCEAEKMSEEECKNEALKLYTAAYTDGSQVVVGTLGCQKNGIACLKSADLMERKIDLFKHNMPRCDVLSEIQKNENGVKMICQDIGYFPLHRSNSTIVSVLKSGKNDNVAPPADSEIDVIVKKLMLDDVTKQVEIFRKENLQ